MPLFDNDTVYLNKEESIEFVNNLIHPDEDYIKHRDEVFAELDRDYTITDCENGFIVTIPDEVKGDDIHK